ncbi:hypothetical protein OJAV_G00224590 [Oryzias javanicus]|uniref:TERF1-interacting nuclear factor 2 N-terminal domain-containing protein n=1 Tax=Oryzias javanicus TaxID=123683 RepID=A0A3S2NUF3_ORYJA|nr:hypothetical protein OJAV_G00224590 [Oryzias javanicus]
MDRRSSRKGPGSSLPLASLRLMASPLQLTYSYIWQVIRQKDVKQYGKVEEFVTMVTQTVPELLSFKQTAQLILGLRARIILELLNKEGPPDLKAIQTLINKLKVTTSSGKDNEVEKSQTNFMVLVQNLLKNPNEKKRFFKEVFPLHYGTKFDTALQALIAGLVCKLEQLLPVPNLSQLGSLISTEPSVLDACGALIPDQGDLKTLLLHQQAKGLLGVKATVSTSVGDCVLSSLAFLPKPVEPPPPPPKQPEVTHDERSNASLSDHDDVGCASENSDSQEVFPESPLQRETANDKPTKEADPAASAPQESPPQSSDGAPPPPDKPEPQQLPLKSIPFRVVQVPVKPAAATPNAGSTGAKEGSKPQTQRVTLHQWVSQIASNTMSLPALPPLPPAG